ncbi:hypothetical protein HD806DRAFT_257847 [Xylariaceae sp. AK1471]|nr:hypothetical protein HD806DRAFT_257847 [Xylariaceae sp. AK1471]
MKTHVLFASLALPLLAIAREQVPLQHQSPLEFVDRLFQDPDEKPQLPPESFLSMLDTNKLCGNVSTVMLSAGGMGSLTFSDGKAYVRNNTENGLSVPVSWTIAALKQDAERFAVFHTDPFGTKYYLYDNGGHLSITTSSSSAGRYLVRYTSDLKQPSVVLSAASRCLAVYPGDDKVYLQDNSPCTPLVFRKVEASGTARGSGGEALDAVAPIRWYDPVGKEENPTCPSTLKKYMNKYKSGELNELMALSRDEMHAQGWPDNLGNFISTLPLSIVAAAACGIACAAGSVHCVPCQGEGGII